MRSQNIKHNSSGKIGGASCLLLLLLTSLTLNPLSASSAFAEESPETSEEAAEGEIDPQAATDSTVNISFLPTAASGTVTPVNSAGDKAKVDVRATVRVQNSGGYSVYVGSSSSQLKSGTNTIDSVESATTYTNLPVNSWGYAFLKNGATSTDSTTYNAMPATLRSEALDTNTNTNITDETRTYTLSFAANIGADKPAGTYTNSVTMSVVSSPLVIAEEFAYDFDGITYMQAMTTAICDAAPTGGVKQLKDTRDGKYYWIGKMKDGKCWMTQNLDLDLNEKTLPLTPETSDVSKDWTPKNGETVLYTANSVNESTVLPSVTGQRSWSLGDYSIINPTDSTNCGKPLENVAACAGNGTQDRFKYYTTPTTADGNANAHYILGNHYQWNAAVAGTGGTIAGGQADDSICPKGWQLPTSSTSDSGSISGLLKAYSIISESNSGKLVSAPLYFVRGGDVGQTKDILFENGGDWGNYWSSTRSSTVDNAYRLVFYRSTFNPSNGVNRIYGFSIRCIAR